MRGGLRQSEMVWTILGSFAIVALIALFVGVGVDGENEAPVVTDFNIPASEIYRGQEIQLYFNGTDNETPEEDLTPVLEYRAQTDAPYGVNYMTTGWAEQMAVSADGKYFVIGTEKNDNNVTLFERGRDEPLWSYRVGDGEESEISSVDISADGNYIVVGSENYKVYLFERNQSYPVWINKLEGHVNEVKISADGNYIIVNTQRLPYTESHDRLYFFERENPTPLWSFKDGQYFRLTTMSLSADGKYISAASAGDDDKLYLFERNSSTPLWNYTIGGWVRASISADGKYIVAGSSGQIHLFERNSSTPLWNHTTSYSNFIISADGRYILASFDKQLFLLNRTNGSEISNYTLVGYPYRMAISNDGQSIAARTVCPDQKFYLFDRNDSNPLWTHPSIISRESYALSADGLNMIVGHNDNRVYYIHQWQSELISNATYTKDYWQVNLSHPAKANLANYTFRMRFLDPQGGVSQWLYSNTTVTVVNRPPTAFIESITPTQADQTQPVTFSGNCSDSDGYITEIRWESNLDGYLTNRLGFTFWGLSVGNHTISFRVKDNDEQWSESFNTNISITANIPPEVTIFDPEVTEIYRGQQTPISLYGSDDLTPQEELNLEMQHETFDNVQQRWNYTTNGSIKWVGISRDGRIIVTTTTSNEILVFDKDRGTILQQYYLNDGIQSIEISSTARYIAASTKHHLYFFDINDNHPLWTAPFQPCREYYGYDALWFNEHQTAVDISADGKYVGASIRGGSLNLYNNTNGSFILTTFLSGPYRSTDIALSNDGCYVVDTGEGELMLYDTSKTTPLWSKRQHNGLQSQVDISSDGSYIVMIHNVKNGMLIQRISNENDIQNVSSDLDNKTISPFLISVFDIVDYKISVEDQVIVNVVNKSWVIDNTYNLEKRDGEIFIYLHDMKLRYFARNNSNRIWFAEFLHPLHSVDMSADGKFIFTATVNRTLHLFDSSGYFDPVSKEMAPLWSYRFPYSNYSLESLVISDSSQFLAATWNHEGSAVLDIFNKDHNLPFWSDTLSGLSAKDTLAMDETGHVIALATNSQMDNQTTGTLFVFERWSPDYIKDTSFNSTHWIANFSAPLDAKLGTYDLRGRLLDSKGGISNWSYKYNVIKVINNPPTAHIEHIPPAPVYNTQTLSFKGYGFDIDGDRRIVEYQWYSSLDGLLGIHASLNITGLSVGNHTLFFRVKDSDGGWSENTTINMTVLLNLPPEALTIDASKLRLLRGQNLTIFLNATDDRTTEEGLEVLLGYYMSPQNPPAWSYRVNNAEIYAVDVSADGQYIAVGAWDHYLYLFNTNSSEPIWSSYVPNVIWSVAISSDGEYIALGAADNNLYFFERDNSEPLWIHEFDEDVQSVAISGDGKYVTAAVGHYVYLFDGRKEALLWSYSTLDAVSAVDISIDGKYIVVASRDDSLYFFHHNKATPVWNYTANSNFHCVAISTDGNTIAAGTTGGELYTFDRNNSTPLWNFSAGDRIATIDITNDGQYLAAGSNANQVYFFGLGSSIPLWNFSTGSKVNSVSISAEGDLLGVGVNNGMIYCFNTSEGVPVWRSESSKRVFSVSLSANGEIMAAGTFDSFIHLFGINSNGISDHHYRNDFWQANFTLGYDLPVGNLTLRVRLIDQHEGTSPWFTANFTIEVLNNIPETTIEYIAPQSMAVINQTVYFNGSGFDLEGPIIGYSWLSDLDGLIGTNASFNTTNLSAGNHTISFSVMDNDGDWSPYVNHSLRINNPPTAYISSIRPSPTVTGARTTLDGFGRDSDGSISNYSWRSDIDGLLNKGLSVGTLNVTNLSAGDHIIFFSVMDDDGVWSIEDNVSLHVNARPIVAINETTPILIQPGEEFTLYSDSIDPDGEIVRYRWLLAGVGYVANGSYKFKHTMSINDPGWYNFYFDVLDNEGAWSYPDNWSIRVNAPPEAFIDDIFPQMVTKQTNESFSISAHATDSDGEVVRYHWNFSGYDHETTTGLPMLLPTASLPSGNLTVFLSVQDNDGAWSSRVESWLHVNKPPTAKVLRVFTEEKSGHMLVTLRGHGNDRDGKIVAYQWFSDIDGYFKATSTSTFELKNLSLGAHNFSLRVQDDFGSWSEWVEYEKPVTVTEGLDPDKFHMGGLAIPKWPLYILLVLIVVGIGYMGSRHINITIVQKEVVEPRNRLLELRQQVEAAELEFPKENLEALLDKLDFWHYREAKFEVTRIQLQMEKLLDKFAATRTLLTEVGELADQAEEAKHEVDRERLEEAEKLFGERKLDEAHWMAISLRDELKAALGLDEEEEVEPEEPEPGVTTSFIVESSGVLRCGRCGELNSITGKLIPATFKCKGCGTKGEVKV